MASFKLRHFANAETLRAVRPQFRHCQSASFP